MPTHATPGSTRAINSPIISGCASVDIVVCLSVMSLRHGPQTHRSSFPSSAQSFDCCRLLSSCSSLTCWCSPNLSQFLRGHALPFGFPKSRSPSTSLLTFLQALCLSGNSWNRQTILLPLYPFFFSKPSDIANLNSFSGLTFTTRPRKLLQLLQPLPQTPQQLSIHYNVRGADRGKLWTSCFISVELWGAARMSPWHGGPYQ